MELTALILTIGVSTYLLYYLVILPIKTFSSLRNIPSPKNSLPILGNALELWNIQHEFDKVLSNWMDECGSRLTVWASYWFPMVILGNAKDAKKILGSRDHVKKGLFYKAFDLAIGTGMFNAPVPIWKQKRPLLEQAFHSKVLSRTPEVFDKCGRKLVEILEEDGYTNGETFDIHPYINLCAMQMLIEGGMEVPVNVMDQRNNPYWKDCIDSYNSGTYLCEYRMLRPWYLIFDWLWSITPSAKEMQRVFEWSNYSLFAPILESKREIRKAESSESVKASDGKGEGKMPSFLDLFLDLQKSHPQLNITEQDILYEMASLFIAGHDATGKGIAFTLLFLGHNQEYQDKVMDELDEVLGRDTNSRPITEADLKKMTYLECCVKESLRLMPPVSLITRQAGSDIKLDDDVVIPKGTEVAIATFLVHRDPSVYPHPNEFQPERFLPENSKGRDPYAWIPFSAGPRNCMGSKFAMMEEKAVLANILRKYRVISIGKKNDWVVNTNVTLKLEGGWNVQLIRRRL